MTLALFAITSAWAQEHIGSVNGGYVFTNLQRTDINASGWRIDGRYEFNPNNEILSHGLVVGYLSTTATGDTIGQEVDYKLNNWPIYYAPKVMFGKNKIKAFVKGALGIHFSGYERRAGTTAAEVITNDTGFFGGASVGAMIFFTENFFLNVEYEWSYLSNSYYRNGMVNSAMGGLGIRF